VLFVGNSKPHKDFRLLAAALEHLPDLSLVCIGISRAELDAARIPVRANWRLLDHVSDRTLAALYRGAECLAVPSRCEGFGLPALEAQTQGTPVAFVCAAVREAVAEGGGVQTPPDPSPQQFAEAVTLAIGLRGPEFALRAAAHVARFQWSTSAEVVSDALRELAA
jgi:mannosyltransferase